MPESDDLTTRLASGGRFLTTFDIEEPVTDPSSRLRPTARSILKAAKEVLLEKGVPGFTVDAVTERAGVNKAAVSYYFGGKDGLIAAVVDSTVATAFENWLSSARAMPADPEARIAHMLEVKTDTAENEEAYRLLFGVLPFMLVDLGLRAGLEKAYEGYRSANLTALGLSPDDASGELDGLPALMTAVTDGLATQRMISGGKLSVRPSISLFGRMLRLYMKEAQQRLRDSDAEQPSNGTQALTSASGDEL
jgi:AcrR family transcriptional regulator